MEKNHLGTVLRAAFPRTIPIMAGYLFLGAAFGIYMKVSGFSAVYALAMSLAVYAGSMQFVAVSLLAGAFDPLGALMLTIMVNARHIFYGISMMEKYNGTGRKKPYLIFGLTDETFSVVCTADIPKGTDSGLFYFCITLLNQIYWVAGTLAGSIFGSMAQFNAEGLEFVMTALLIVIFVENWLKEKEHISSVTGVASAVLCLVIFGRDNFIIPSMIMITAVLTAFRKLKGGNNTDDSGSDNNNDSNGSAGDTFDEVSAVHSLSVGEKDA
ncbi:MAG: AzlC family ABC transporter permease [Clostridia bacterium]|nr:AzlC family ABC transporter permease [Clostridia bacterium]